MVNTVGINKLLILGVVLWFVGGGNPVKAIEYGGIGGRPAYPRPDAARSDSIFIHTVTPGEVIKEGVNVINNTKETKIINVYAADYTSSSDGGYACKQFKEEKKIVGKWVTLEKSEITLTPYKTELVPFTISIPQDLEIGEYNGCILIQEKKASSKTGGINLSIRTGLRILLTVPGNIVKTLEIQNFEIIKKENGDFILKPSVRNMGNVSVEANVKVVTKDMFNKTVFEHGGQYSIIRGETSKWNFDFKQPALGGWYSSALEISYLDQANQTVNLATRKVSFFSMPKPGVIKTASGILLSGLVILLIVIIKRHREKLRFAKWGNHTVLDGEDVQHVANQYRADWKEMAKVNKLKPPYGIKPGDKIKVPHDYA